MFVQREGASQLQRREQNQSSTFFPSSFHSAPFLNSVSSLCNLYAEKGAYILSFGDSGYMSAERANQGAEARSCIPALSGSQGKEAGGKQDQSTFRIILEICSGKGSDVRY